MPTVKKQNKCHQKTKPLIQNNELTVSLFAKKIVVAVLVLLLERLKPKASYLPKASIVSRQVP